MATDLVVATQAVKALAGVSDAAATLLAQVRNGSIVRQADRDLLRMRLAVVRRENIARCIADLSSQQLSLLFDLFDQVERHANNPAKYRAALEVVQQTSDQLADNTRRFIREIQ